MAPISRQSYLRLAAAADPRNSFGYAVLPGELLAAEKSVSQLDRHAACELNRALCRSLLERFSPAAGYCALTDKVSALYAEQLGRIEALLDSQSDDYFAFSNDPFRKDLAILRHRLIPCGAEFATPFSGLPRILLVRGGLRQAGRFVKAVVDSRGLRPFLELHLHPQCTAAFNPAGWLDTYENLADLLVLNPSLRGVQSTSWFLDPALEAHSPHLAYLRQVPEQCGAVFLYAGEDDCEHSGAFLTSQTRRALFAAGCYRPRLFTRIWPRQAIGQRSWRKLVCGALVGAKDGIPHG